MKKVLILFSKSDWKTSVPFSNKKYMYSYEYFYNMCKEEGVQMYRASYQWYDYRKGIFKYAWIFEKKGGGWKRVYDIKPDLIYDKTKTRTEIEYKKELIGRRYNFFNNLEFTKIIDNKLNTSLLFSEWTKKNWLVNNIEDLSSVLNKITTEKAVLKPISLSGGEGIFIEDKEELIEVVNKSGVVLRDYILQDFIDSSKGIPGVIKGVHDFRMVFVNDDLAYSYYRLPAEGSLLANLAQGGTMNLVSLNDLPTSLQPMIKRSKEIFSSFGSKVYTIDVMFDEKKRPWVVELNSMPGMCFEPGQERTKRELYDKLLKVFKENLEIS